MKINQNATAPDMANQCNTRLYSTYICRREIELYGLAEHGGSVSSLGLKERRGYVKHNFRILER